MMIGKLVDTQTLYKILYVDHRDWGVYSKVCESILELDLEVYVVEVVGQLVLSAVIQYLFRLL